MVENQKAKIFQISVESPDVELIKILEFTGSSYSRRGRLREGSTLIMGAAGAGEFFAKLLVDSSAVCIFRYVNSRGKLVDPNDSDIFKAFRNGYLEVAESVR